MKALVKSSIALALTFSSMTAFAQNSIFARVNPNDVPAGLSYTAVQPPVNDPRQFQGKRIAIVAAHGVQESELVFPYLYLRARGATVDIVAPSWSEGKVLVVQYLKPTLWVKSTETFQTAAHKNYDLIVLTGGAWNSTVVRNDPDALKLVQSHFSRGRWIAAICSGTEVLVDSGIARGRRLTGTHTGRTGLVNAGAHYIDQAVVIDGHLITSRNPDDLIPFVTAFGAALD